MKWCTDKLNLFTFSLVIFLDSIALHETILSYVWCVITAMQLMSYINEQTKDSTE